MILQGSQRGGAKNLGQHLLKSENEHVTVHDLRGFVSDELTAALNEVYAISRATKAKQYLFSVSLNPPENEEVSTQDFEDAISRIESEFGLEAQPRAIVFHEKEGRRHCHAVWSRIDMRSMKAIQLSYTKLRFREISRELYIKHGWEMPRGFINAQERNPLNFTLAQWQQAKRTGKDPKQIKAALQDCWSISDNQSAFESALKDQGFTLARGDRRGFVVLDPNCEVYSASKWIGIKAKHLRAKLKEPNNLPSTKEAKQRTAAEMSGHLRSLKDHHQRAVQERLAQLDSQKQSLTAKHKRQRAELEATQQKRWLKETRARQERYNKGIQGFWDRLTGRRKKTKLLNEQETRRAARRDQAEKDKLVFKQLHARQQLRARELRLMEFSQSRVSGLDRDISAYPHIERKPKNREIHRESTPIIEPER